LVLTNTDAKFSSAGYYGLLFRTNGGSVHGLYDDFVMDSGEFIRVDVEFDKNSLTPRSGNILITSNEASNSPLTIPITQAGGCPEARFAAEDTVGHAPLMVQFNDLSLGGPTAWKWDFQNDGVTDATSQSPTFVYDEPGDYSVSLVSFFSGGSDTLRRMDYIHVLPRDTLSIESVLVTQAGQLAVPITFDGIDSLGVISMYVNYDPAKLTYRGVQNHVPGEFFSAGLVGGRISIQWFDETGGMDPILPAEADTLCSLLFTSSGASEDSTQLHFEFAACQTGIGDRRGDPIAAVSWRDQHPYGKVVIRFQAMVSGSVIYYSGSRPVADAVLSLGPPNSDVATDAAGHYAFLPYAVGNYTLHVAKQSDLGGINSLDALKVIRHSTGVEPFGNPDKVFVANVNGDSYVNAFDAIKIVRAAVALEPLSCGNWAFAPSLVNFAPLLADTAQNFKAFRMGDANGDWSGGQLLLAAAGTKFEAQSTTAGAVTLSLPDTTIGADRTSLSLVLHVRDFLGIGAVSLRIQFADSVLHYTNLTSQAGVTFTSNLVGSEIRIEWFDMTGGSQSLNIASGNLLTLNFAVVGTPPDSSQVRFTPLCTLADAAGNPLSGVAFQNGRMNISSETGVTEPSVTPSRLSLDACRPNPFNPRTTISYSLPTPGRVTLAIYDLRGARVATVVDADLPAGEQSAEWAGVGDGGTPMPSGVYFARLETSAGVRTVKVTLAK
jgi:PKD repeat protein